jgi:hypothetical protein
MEIHHPAMKKKKLTYFLLAVTVVIWGLIFIRIFDSVDTEAEEMPAAVNTKNTPMSTSAVPDTFSLLANYRDPFLGNSSHHGIQPDKPTVKPKDVLKVVAPPLPPKALVDWSVITYLGLINNPKTNKSIALINLKGREYMVAEGESIEEIKIIKNLKDSLLVTYQAENKYLKPSKRPF